MSSTTQISKIQLRRGQQADLPGSTTFGLDVAEVAFTTDTNRLFIGADPTTAILVGGIHAAQNAGAAGFPFSNVEILTEFSPANQTIFNTEARNITTAFIISLPLALTGPDAWAPVMIQQITGFGGVITPIPFVINAQSDLGQFGTAHISYHIIDYLTGTPLRTGRLKLLYQGNAFPPAVIDDAIVNPFAGFATAGSSVDPNLKYGMIAFQAVAVADGIALNYQINLTGANLPQPILYFRVESPLVLSTAPVTPASNTITTTIFDITDSGFLPYDVVGDMLDSPVAGEAFFTFVFVRGVAFTAGLPTSQAVCGLPPTNAVVLPILVNNMQVGSINFAPGATIGSFTLASNLTVLPGQTLSLLGPTPVDPSFGEISYSISGTVIP